MSKLSRKIAVLLAVAAFLGVAGPASAALAIIANPSNTLEGISANQVTMIFLGKTDHFSNGQPAVPVDQNQGSPVRAKFYRNVVQKDPTELTTYWSKLIFTGKGQRPQEIGNDEAVKQWVASHPSGLGYVDGSVLDRTVKVLLIVP
ncbi:MAG: type 2 periplasmic-binding domain-containing protein [Acidiferrobacterales bacterium]